MKIQKVSWKNFNSYGSEWSELLFDSEHSLNLLLGKNGNGKCVQKDTIIEIEFEDKNLEKQYAEFLKKN